VTRKNKRARAARKRAHEKDRYVREAGRIGARSRAYFKLQHIDQKHKIFADAQTVIDLGASPGGWSQYAASKVGPNGKVIAIDLLDMKEIAGVDFFQGDITSSQVTERINSALAGRGADAVLSDMAPNISGNCLVDARNYAEIYQAVFEVCGKALADGGSLVLKFFQTNESKQLKDLCSAVFAECRIQKPLSSRGASQESYIVAKGFNHCEYAVKQPLLL